MSASSRPSSPTSASINTARSLAQMRELSESENQGELELEQLSTQQPRRRAEHVAIQIENLGNASETESDNTMFTAAPQRSATAVGDIQTPGVINDQIADDNHLVGERRNEFLRLAALIDHVHNQCILDPHAYKAPSFRTWLANSLAGGLNNLMSWAPATGLGAVLTSLRTPVAEEKMAQCVNTWLADHNFTSVVKDGIAGMLENAPAGTERLFSGASGQAIVYSVTFGLAAMMTLAAEPASHVLRNRLGGATAEFGISSPHGRAPVSYVRSMLGSMVGQNLPYLLTYIFMKTLVEKPFLEKLQTDPTTAVRLISGGTTSFLTAITANMLVQGILMIAAHQTLGGRHPDEVGSLAHVRTAKPGVYLREPGALKNLAANQEPSRVVKENMFNALLGLVGAALAAGVTALLAEFEIGGGKDFRAIASNTTNTTLPGMLNATSTDASIDATVDNSVRNQMVQSGVPLLVGFMMYWLTTSLGRAAYNYRTLHPDVNALRHEIASSRLSIKRLEQCQFNAYEDLLKVALTQCAPQVQQMALTRVLTSSTVTRADTTQAQHDIDGVIRQVSTANTTSQSPDDQRTAERTKQRLIQQLEVMQRQIGKLDQAIAEGNHEPKRVQLQNNLGKLARELPHIPLQLQLSSEDHGLRFELDDLAHRLTTAVLPLCLSNLWKTQTESLSPIYQTIGLSNTHPADSAIEKLVAHHSPQEVVESFDMYAADRNSMQAKFEHWLNHRPAVKDRHDIIAHLMLQQLRNPPAQAPQQATADQLVQNLLQGSRSQNNATALLGALETDAVDFDTLNNAVAQLVPIGTARPRMLDELMQALDSWSGAEARGVTDNDVTALREGYRSDIEAWPVQINRMIKFSSSLPPPTEWQDFWHHAMTENIGYKIDAHSHPTNYARTIASLLEIYEHMADNKIIRSNMAAIPSLVNYCCGREKYYTSNYNKLQYNDADMDLMHQFNQLPEYMKAAFDVSFTGLNINDPWAIGRHLAQKQRMSPDSRHFGEGTFQKEIVADKTPSPVSILIAGQYLLWQLGTRGMTALLHCDSHKIDGKRMGDAEKLFTVLVNECGEQALGEITQLEIDARKYLGVLAENMPPRKIRVSVGHAMMGKFAHPTLEHTHYLDEILSGLGIQQRISDFLDMKGIHDVVQRSSLTEEITEIFENSLFFDLSWDVISFHMYSNVADQLERLANESTDVECARNLRTLSQAFRAFVEQYKIYMQVGAAADKAEDMGMPEQTAALLAASRGQYEQTRLTLATAIAQLDDTLRHPATRNALAGAIREHGPSNQNNWLYLIMKYFMRFMFGTDALTFTAKAHGKELYTLNTMVTDLFFRFANIMETGDPFNEGQVTSSIARDNYIRYADDPDMIARSKLLARYEQRMEVASTTGASGTTTRL